MGAGREGQQFMSTEITMDKDESGSNPGKPDHRDTYDAFMATTKWAVAGIAVVLIVLAIVFVPKG